MGLCSDSRGHAQRVPQRHCAGRRPLHRGQGRGDGRSRRQASAGGIRHVEHHLYLLTPSSWWAATRRSRTGPPGAAAVFGDHRRQRGRWWTMTKSSRSTSTPRTPVDALRGGPEVRPAAGAGEDREHATASMQPQGRRGAPRPRSDRGGAAAGEGELLRAPGLPSRGEMRLQSPSAAGDGLKEPCSWIWACDQIVVSGGQTMNPSTEDIAGGRSLATPAKMVFVLPNNKNILMAAEQTVPLGHRPGSGGHPHPDHPPGAFPPCWPLTPTWAPRKTKRPCWRPRATWTRAL